MGSTEQELLKSIETKQSIIFDILSDNNDVKVNIIDKLDKLDKSKSGNEELLLEQVLQIEQNLEEAEQNLAEVEGDLAKLGNNGGSLRSTGTFVSVGDN